MQKKKTREPARSKESKHIKIKDRISIDERPQEVIGREIPGHWEGDLIIGKDHKSAIVTLVERSIRAVNLVHLKDKSTETVRKAFEKEF
uniref:IS30 family transposase n=1 Tax=Empedobacter stercoris TaxID=1628248 RepID=UPI001CE1FDA6|nr:IS30 family transposase [Empedobacter stercoris]